MKQCTSIVRYCGWKGSGRSVLHGEISDIAHRFRNEREELESESESESKSKSRARDTKLRVRFKNSEDQLVMVRGQISVFPV